MKNAILIGVSLLTLMIGAPILFATAAKNADGDVQVASAETASPVKAHWEVLGWGENRDEALRHALPTARGVIKDYLGQQSTRFTWSPDDEWIEKHLLDNGEKKDVRPQEEKDIGGKKIIFHWYAFSLTLTEEDYQAIRAEQHQANLQERGFARLLIAAKVLFLLLIGLTLTWVFLKVEEKTKGLSSRYLGLGLVVIFALAGLAVLLWR
jgi:hypothetical protein